MRETDATCIWCNRSEGELRTIEAVTTDRLGRNPHREEFVVHPRHAAPARSFLAFAAEHAKTFVAVMVAGTVLAVALGISTMELAEGGARSEGFWFSVLYGPYLLLFGSFIVRFPFSTPETVKWLGLEKAKVLARAMGWLCVGLGGWFLATAW